jgi:hypothetical protein
MRKHGLLLFLTLTIIGLLELSGWAQGCAMCKTALEQSAEGQQLAKSFDYGILFLMGVPYALFGTAGLVAFRAYRKHTKKSEAEKQ